MINGNAQECLRAFPHASLLVQIFQLLIQGTFYSTTEFKTICTSLQRDTQLKRMEPTAHLYFGESTCVITLEIMNAKQKCQTVLNAVLYNTRPSGRPQLKSLF